MPTKDQAIQILRSSLFDLHRAYGVKRIGLFGSVVRGEQEPGSDVDLIVEFDRPIGFKFVDLAVELERLLGAKVDLLTSAGVENIRNPKIAEAIQETVVYV